MEIIIDQARSAVMIAWILSTTDRQSDDADSPIVVRAPNRHDAVGHALRRAFEADPAPVDREFSALLARLG